MGEVAQDILFERKSPSLGRLECTIGICAYNEERNISNLLQSLINNRDLSKNAEILVVCSGCTDTTPQIVAQLSKMDRRIELIVQRERLGKASAINEILRRASHEFIFLVPADVLPAPHSLVAISEEFRDPSVGVACGSPLPINEGKSFSGYLARLVWRIHNRTLKHLSDSNLSTHASGELMALRRGLIKAIPDYTVNDDAYVAIQAVSKGYHVKYSESAKVFMKAPSNVVDFIKQRRRIIFGHHSVRRSTGHFPRTLETMVYYDIGRVKTIMRQEIREHPSDLLKLALAIGLEFLVNALALLDLATNRTHVSWSVATSTKDLSNGIPRVITEYPQSINNTAGK